jgi:hypothetical protein
VAETNLFKWRHYETHGNDSYGNGPFRFIVYEKLSEVIDLKEHTR